MNQKDPFDFPVEHLEALRLNFIGRGDMADALKLTNLLIPLIANKDVEGIDGWLAQINFDPEILGSAFNQVHRFTKDFRSGLKS